MTLAREAAALAGVPFRAIKTGGGSDANTLSELGLPSACLSAAMRQPHTRDEHVAARRPEPWQTTCLASSPQRPACHREVGGACRWISSSVTSFASLRFPRDDRVDGSLPRSDRLSEPHRRRIARQRLTPLTPCPHSRTMTYHGAPRLRRLPTGARAHGPRSEVAGVRLLVVRHEALEDVDQHALFCDQQFSHFLNDHPIEIRLGLRHGHAAVRRDFWHGHAAVLGLRKLEDAALALGFSVLAGCLRSAGARLPDPAAAACREACIMRQA